MMVLRLVRVKAVIKAIFTSLVMLLGLSLRAEGFLESYDRALLNDKQYAVVDAQTQAAREAIPQAKARLLPQVTWTSSRYDVDQSRKDASRNYPDQSYRSESDALQVRQPLYQPRLWASLRQTEFAVQAAEAGLIQEKQSLLIRLAERFFDLALARERIRLARAQQSSADAQYDAAQKALVAGVGTKTDLLEVRAQRDRIEAASLQARQAELTARAQLEAMLGEEPKGAPVFVSRAFEAKDWSSLTRDEWVAQSLAGSLELSSQQARVQAAQQAVRMSRYEHFPSLDFVGQSVRSSSEETLLINSETKTTSVGVVLSVPIYQGGAVSSRERQSQASLQEAQQRLDFLRNQLKVEVSKAFFSVNEGVRTVEALEKALRSNEEALIANQKSLQAGVRRALDVLAAEQRLIQTQLDLQTARMQTILAWARLQVFSGKADRGLAQKLDSFFKYDDKP